MLAVAVAAVEAILETAAELVLVVGAEVRAILQAVMGGMVGRVAWVGMAEPLPY